MRAEIIDRVLASVNGRVITLSLVRAVQSLGLMQVQGSAGTDQPQAILDRVIDRVLVLGEVARYAPPEPDASAIDKAFAAVRARFPSDDAFDAALRQAGVERRFVRQWVRNDLRIAAYLDQRFAGAVEPTDDELENYRRQHEAELEAPGQAVDEAEILREARARVTAERRLALVKEWIEGLRSRAEISVNPPPAAGSR